jgi:hypothetical protein
MCIRHTTVKHHDTLHGRSIPKGELCMRSLTIMLKARVCVQVLSARHSNHRVQLMTTTGTLFGDVCCCFCRHRAAACSSRLCSASISGPCTVVAAGSSSRQASAAAAGAGNWQPVFSGRLLGRAAAAAAVDMPGQQQQQQQEGLSCSCRCW